MATTRQRFAILTRANARDPTSIASLGVLVRRRFVVKYAHCFSAHQQAHIRWSSTTNTDNIAGSSSCSSSSSCTTRRLQTLPSPLTPPCTTMLPFSTVATLSAAAAHSSTSTTNTTNTAAAAPATSIATRRATTNETNSNDKWWEVIMSTLVACAVSATLVAAFPQVVTAASGAAATLSSTFYQHPQPHRPSSSSSSSSNTTNGSSSSGDNHQGSSGGGGSGNHKSVLVAEPSQLPGRKASKKPSTAVAGRSKEYDVSVRAIKGGRLTMEDRYFVADGGKFAAIFDGHGGADVSTFLRDFLYENVCHQLQLKLWQDESASSTSSSRRSNSSKIFIPSVSTQVVALRAAFEQMEKEVLEDDRMQYQGSTAVAVVVNESEDGHRTLLSANVGDSRAILSRRGRAVDLTRDHKPSDEWEKARILAMGESIEWDNFSKVHRVRNLSLSRAIGDRYAKPAVSSEVEIKHFLVLDTDEFVLLASDGLWDVMTSQEVVSFVHQRLDSELERDQLLDHRFDSGEESVNHFIRENMAKFVAREAIRRGSGDNISVVMVFLNDITMRSP